MDYLTLPRRSRFKRTALLFSAAALLLLTGCQAPFGGPTAAAPINLLASADLAEWDHILADPETPKEAVWSFNEAGHLVCTGLPKGFLATKAQYTDFHLVVEWRWPAEPSNSGVLMRIRSAEPIPTCLEAQLKSGAAGNLMGLRGAVLQGPHLERRESANIGQLHILPRQGGAERPVGEWNRYEITVQGESVRVRLNGELANEASGAEILAGPIGFQSEGGPIEFRTLELTPL